MTDFFKIRVENLEPKKNTKILISCQEIQGQEIHEETQTKNSNSGVIDSSEKYSMGHKPIKEYCILHGK